MPSKVEWMPKWTWPIEHVNALSSPRFSPQTKSSSYGRGHVPALELREWNLHLSLDEVDKDISDAEDALSSLTRSDPLFPSLIRILGLSRLNRYTLSHNQQDRDKSLIYQTHSIFLPFDPFPDGSHPIPSFFLLSRALLDRSYKLKQLSGVEYCVKYFHFLRDRSFEAFDIGYYHVTTLLVHALSLQAQWNPECGAQDLEKISALCSELLAPNVEESLLDDAIPALAQTIINFASTTSVVVLSPRIIECLREANRRLPHSLIVARALFVSHFVRLISTEPHGDYEDTMATLDRTVASHSAADIPGEDMRDFFREVELLAFRTLNGDPRYVEEAILGFRTLVSNIPFDDPVRAATVPALAILENRRFEEFGVVHDRQEPHFDDPGVVNISDLLGSLAKSNVGKYTFEELHRHHRAAIKYCRLLLVSLQSGPVGGLTVMTTLELSRFFRRVFKVTHRADYLNESIAIFRATKVPRASWWHPFLVLGLISSLLERFMFSHDKRDLEEIFQLYPFVTDSQTQLTLRLKTSHQWALISHRCKHPSTSIAYETSISLMHESLTFAPTLEIQHARIVSMRNIYQELPLNFASYQVDIGQIENAIETLERGRALLWSEMRGLRTSVDQLRVVNSSLAERIATINRDLEALTTSTFQDPWIASECSRVEGLNEMDPMGHLVVKQQNLVEERNKVILQIQALPGFDFFLKVPSFDTLRSAAVHGPVIIINHSKCHSDIIILLHDRHPSRIPTSADFYSRANRMTDELHGARKTGLESKEYEETLSSVLAELYDLIGQQVIKRFHLLNVPEQSRVWWCPTSVLCSLPLHAMGPIQNDGCHKLYFSDLYIPSYTPTLSALIEARRHGAESLQMPPILLVMQPDVKMPNALQEMRVVQAIANSVTTLTWDTATPSTTLEHLRDHRFLHISCHGKLEIGKPFNASFKLNQGTSLTLLEIVRSQLPTAEFAFLSACHTAEITEESIADEGLHLTAAVQYCGFRSVVGTMWAMADIDGPDLAGHFYRAVFSDRRGGIPHYERTAEALRDAVRSVRRKKHLTLERWVNFVHYGA
ncbi:CHAT domain-containing protein [Russula dissimulans]|nr:CHAT domain-containing protein [Russula dissimulans]